MKKILSAAFILGMIAAGCKKEVIKEPKQYNIMTGSLAAFFIENAPAVQTFTVDATSPYGVITGLQGTRIMIYGNAFLTQSDQPVTGNVTLKLQEVYSEKDIILSGGFTVAEGKPLISGGEIHLTAWQGTDELKLNPSGAVVVNIPAGSSPSYAMNEFYAREINDTADFNPVDTSQFIPIYNYSQSVYSYSFEIDQLNWINCDYYMAQGGQQTPIKATVASPFDETNCRIFVAFNGHRSAAGCNLVFSQHEFTPGPWYTLPLGMSVTFVAIAEINGQFYSAFQSATIGNNHNEVMSLVPTTQTQIVRQLNNLR